MQIELIGCTSAGKSTLAKAILRACREQKLEIFLGEEFVLRQARLNWVKNHRLRKLLLNVVALSASLVTWRTHLKFYRFATRLLFQLPIPQFERLGLLRNVLKKIGIYEIIRFRSTGQQVILVDEGALQTAHNLFAHGAVEVKTEGLSTFVGLVPLPDVAIYLRQPEGLLINRTRRRGHRRIQNRSYDQIVRFVKQAVVTFDKLGQYPAVKRRLLVIDGYQQMNMAPNDHNDLVVELVLKIIRSGFSSIPSYQLAGIIYVE